MNSAVSDGETICSLGALYESLMLARFICSTRESSPPLCGDNGLSAIGWAAMGLMAAGAGLMTAGAGLMAAGAGLMTAGAGLKAAGAGLAAG